MIVVIGCILGAIVGLIFAALRHRIPRLGTVKGLALAIVLFALIWFPFSRTAAEDLKRQLPDPLLIATTTFISAIWIAYGAALGAISERLEKRWRRFSPGPIRNTVTGASFQR